jgi:LmbE family N-acetylglucosaminyl deacetylase
MKVLIVAAHPDDEVLGCGATAARLVRERHQVNIAILAEGITSRSLTREEADAVQVETLRGHARKAAKALGVEESLLSLHGLPDNRLDTVPLLDVVKIVEEIVQRVAPERIYTHHPGDLNIDHAVVSRAVMIATRPMQGCSVKEVYQFEVPSSTEWAFQQFESAFRPNVFMDISETLELKIKAMDCYESEVRAFPHPRSAEALRVIAKRWGTVVGCNAAEAFQLVRAVF